MWYRYYKIKRSPVAGFNDERYVLMAAALIRAHRRL